MWYLSNRFPGHSLANESNTWILMRIIRLLATGRQPVWMWRAIAKAEAVRPLTVFPPLLAAMRRRLPKAKTGYFPNADFDVVSQLAIGLVASVLCDRDWVQLASPRWRISYKHRRTEWFSLWQYTLNMMEVWSWLSNSRVSLYCVSSGCTWLCISSSL